MSCKERAVGFWNDAMDAAGAVTCGVFRHHNLEMLKFIAARDLHITSRDLGPLGPPPGADRDGSAWESEGGSIT